MEGKYFQQHECATTRGEIECEAFWINNHDNYPVIGDADYEERVNGLSAAMRRIREAYLRRPVVCAMEEVRDSEQYDCNRCHYWVAIQ